jgi:hypothetical protein
VDGYPEYDYNEGRNIFIVTNKGYEKAPEELKPIIWLLSRNPEPIDDPFYRQIQKLVDQAKTDPEVRRQIMFDFEKENAIRREGREEGREEGRKASEREAITNFVKSFRGKNYPEEEIRKTLTDIYPDAEEMIREIMED